MKTLAQLRDSLATLPVRIAREHDRAFGMDFVRVDCRHGVSHIAHHGWDYADWDDLAELGVLVHRERFTRCQCEGLTRSARVPSA